MKTIFAILFMLHGFCSFAYVATRTEYDQKLTWDSRSSSLDIYVDFDTKNGFSTSGLDNNEIENIFDSVINQWSQISPYALDMIETSSLPAIGTSRTIRFSDDTSYFGSGVLAVTTVSHSAATGQIYAADILLNDSINNANSFTDDPSVSGGTDAYLGDVLSHEIGHLLGLGHSEVHGSTMLYSVFKGQEDPHSDELSGLNYLYGDYIKNIFSYDTGTITGKVISADDVAVFGAQVQAISYKTGKVIAGVLTEADGSFDIKFLPSDDSYMVYVLPPRSVDNLPTYYSSILTSYCQGADYKPSFYTKCEASSIGSPQVFSVSSNSSLDVGSVSIKCDEGANPMYLLAKSKSDNYVLQENSRVLSTDQVGETFLGHFTSDDIANGLSGSPDQFEIDLTDFIHPGDGSYSLNIKIVTEDLGSAVASHADIYDYNDTYIFSDQLTTNSIGKVETMLDFDLNLSTTSSENLFYIDLYAVELDTNEKTQLFANTELMTNENSTYLIITSLKKDGTVVGVKDSTPYEDNYYCSQGDAVVTARPNAISSLSDSGSSGGGGDDAPSCGSIDISSNGSGPGGGMPSFFIGLAIGLISLLGSRKSNDFFV